MRKLPFRHLLWNNTFVLALGALGVSLFFLAPLRRPGFPMTDEVIAYPLRLAGIHLAMADGQWAARWLGAFGGGYGYPFFNFYAPGFYYTALLFRTIGLTYANCAIAATVLFSLVGAGGAYLAGRILWRSPAAGFLAALIWTFLPYRILNLYVRGDLAELAAISLMPWVAAGHLLLVRGASVPALGLSVFFHGALLWTHNVAALIFQPFLVAFDLLAAWAEGRLRSGLTWGRLAAAHLLALALGAGFWLPALVEKSLVHTDVMVMRGTHFDVTRQLLRPRNLFTSRWGYGMATPWTDEGLSLQLGWTVVAGVVAGAVGVAVAGSSEEARRNRRRYAAVAGLGVLCLLAMLEPTRPLWQRVPLARFVQFPWRLLSLAGLALALASGAAGPFLERFPRLVYLAALAAAAVAVPWIVAPYLHPLGRARIPDAAVLKSIAGGFITTASVNEYLPCWVPWFDPNLEPRLGGGSLRALRGQARIVPLAPPSASPPRHFQVDADGPVVLLWQHFFFPGWIARVNGVPKGVLPAPDGCILLALAPGSHRVEFVFGDTVVRLAAKYASLLALLALVGLGLHARRKRTDPGLAKKEPQMNTDQHG